MALPASGQIKVSDIFTELQRNTNNNESFWNATSYPLNLGSPSLPPLNATANYDTVSMSDWYSYCHTCAVNCPQTNLDFYNGFNSYKFYVIDLGSSGGNVDWSAYGYGKGEIYFYSTYPWNSSGSITATTIASDPNFVGNISGTFTYNPTYNLYVYAINANPVTVSCPYVRLDWDFGMFADSGILSIDVNSTNQVYETITNSGTIYINIGDVLDISCSSSYSDYPNFQADVSLTVYDGPNIVCSQFQNLAYNASVSCSGIIVTGTTVQVYAQASYI